MQPGGPGWNDPPKLSFKVHDETKCRRNLLNKRVAYLGHHAVAEAGSKPHLDPCLPPPLCSVESKEPCSLTPTSVSQAFTNLNIFTPSSISAHESQKSEREPGGDACSCSSDVHMNFSKYLTELSTVKVGDCLNC